MIPNDNSKEFILDPSCEHLPSIWYAYKHPPTKRKWLSEMLATESPTCALCNHLIDANAPPDDTSNPWRPSLDHILPRSKGGSHDRENMQLTHHRCNAKRGNSDGLTPAQLEGIMKCIPKRLRVNKETAVHKNSTQTTGAQGNSREDI